MAEIWDAEDKDHALAAVKAFDAAYGAKFPTTTAKITDDAEELLAFYDYPGEHWVHLRTTNPIESTFATVQHRTKVTKGPGSRAAGLAMAFKLIESAQDRWRAVNGPHLVALVRAGATFINGKLIERPGEDAEPEAAYKTLITGLDNCSTHTLRIAGIEVETARLCEAMSLRKRNSGRRYIRHASIRRVQKPPAGTCTVTTPPGGRRSGRKR